MTKYAVKYAPKNNSICTKIWPPKKLGKQICGKIKHLFY